MKKAILLFVLITATIGAFAQDEPKLPPDIDMLKFFYTAYMAPYFDGSQPTTLYRKQAVLRQVYCTPRGLARYQQLMQESEDGDPFIKAQDSNPEAVKSLEITRDPKQPNRYTVTYNPVNKVTIELSLITVNGKLMIDYLY
ncbi:MAG: hypothetical protein ABI367_12275 [Mucilaginibacter sp.]